MRAQRPSSAVDLNAIAQAASFCPRGDTQRSFDHAPELPLACIGKRAIPPAAHARAPVWHIEAANDSVGDQRVNSLDQALPPLFLPSAMLPLRFERFPQQGN